MPLLTETFKKIAAGGERVFYNGDLSQQIVSEIQAAGGIITLEDLKLYSPVRRQPVTIKLNDNTMYSPPPPSSGVVLQLILNILEGFNFTRESISKVDEAILTYHRVLEAFKLSYARRTELGDTSFVDIRELVESMQTGQLAEELRSRITDTMTHKTQYYGGIYSQIDDAGTSHICILDEHGNAVSMTSTINYDFGSQVVGNVTGIIYNDEMDDFSTPGLTNTWGYEPSPANYITPGKRPLSSMSPSIIVDKTGDVVMMAGASGGSRIISSMSLAIINAMWFGDSLEEAIMRPRIHHQLLPTEAGYQPQLNQQIIEGLQSKGHVMYVMGSDAEQAVQGILRRGGWIYGFSDERKGGKSAGY
ncbi:glutathione hydrolase 1 proenzyme-like [Saccoglossus kowalevskii]